MTWQDNCVTVTRSLINDIVSTPSYKYTNERLTDVVNSASLITCRETPIFSEKYTILIGTTWTVSPDPIEDMDFILMTSLKAACLIDMGDLRNKASLIGTSARLGPASLGVGTINGFKDVLALGPCATYSELQNGLQFESSYICRAILSPFIGNNFDPAYLSEYFSSYDNRQHYYN